MTMYFGEDHRNMLDVTRMARKHLLSQGFTLDGSDPIVDIHDEVHAFLLSSHEGYTRWIIDNTYDLVGGYDELAERITENLA